MSPDERRESIVSAAVPLFMSQGADVTTRQIAEAAGVAEGTLFRVFPDKQAIVDAVVARFMDPSQALAQLGAINKDLPLHSKVLQVVQIVRARFAGVLGIMDALGLRQGTHDHQHPPHARSEGGGVVAELFADHRDQLCVDPERAVDYVRLLCFGIAVPSIAGSREYSDQELADFILRGITKEGR